jgi:hypothetical protein
MSTMTSRITLLKRRVRSRLDAELGRDLPCVSALRAAAGDLHELADREERRPAVELVAGAYDGRDE